MSDAIVITYDAWEAQYQPLFVTDQETAGDTVGDTVEYPLEIEFDDKETLQQMLQERRLWTELDSDLILSGYHFVNRLRYLVTTRPYPEGADIEVLPHDYEPQQNEATWDTEEIERWALNDEGMYSATGDIYTASEMRQYFEDVFQLLPHLRDMIQVNLDEVDWEQVVRTRQDSETEEEIEEDEEIFESDDDDIITWSCPVCNQESLPMGALGRKLWFRCRACGIEWSQESENDV